MCGPLTARSDRARRNMLRFGFTVLLLASCRADSDVSPVKSPAVSASNEVPRYTIEEILRTQRDWQLPA